MAQKNYPNGILVLVFVGTKAVNLTIEALFTAHNSFNT
jgi:hypothetical protein